ncbi:amino acid adenylation domain-containing protein [Spirillospora sp. CA-294931]|uniref:amino acid adenylation domain-containing protein n=1 Tax=Spirillospora sp. CA-294931 TaxID=3240042 RepID=UPI003D8E8015
MTDPLEPIAVIGVAGRFPGAADYRAFWDNLRQGAESVTPLTDAAMLAAGVPERDLADPSYVKAAALMPGADGFDAGFFGLSERDADLLDPRLRLFAEAVHAAVEDAGYDLTAITRDTGVFGAAGPGRYREDDDDARDPAAFAAGLLDLQGPTAGLSTCSLAAVHLAAQALRSGECGLALAGGVHVQFPYGHGYRWVPGGPHPPDARCRPFDAAAAGGVTGSGVGVVLLKPLDEAILDGDRVRAVIRGDAVAHDGRRPGRGQAVAAAEAMALAGVGPDAISYVEAHGAGTVRSDALEVAELARGYADMGEAPRGSIPIGSVKSNVGNLGAAAGIAGLVKVVLAVEHGLIPATINVSRPNPGLADTPFRPVREAQPWRGESRVAGVHATAPGGAHTHLVVTEGLPPHLDHDERRPRVLVWSGRDREAAATVRDSLARRFTESGGADFAAAVSTLQRGRTEHPVREAAVCANATEAAKALSANEGVVAGSATGGPPHVVFLFPGRDRSRMPTGLYGTQRVFTETMDVCLEAFERENVDPHEGGPALAFAVEYALAATWESWGVRPDSVVAEGTGTLVAEVVAGAKSLDEAVRGIVREPDGLPTGRADRPADGGDRVVLDVGAEDDERGLLAALARLWVRGVPVDWAEVDRDQPMQRVPLPGHPLNRRRHWLGSASAPAPIETETPKAAPAPRAAAIAGLPEPAEPLRPLGDTQHAFWILEQLAPDSGVSNLCIAFRTVEALRWWPLQSAVQQLLRRHPALRLRFPELNGVPVQHLTAPEDAQIKLATRATSEEKLVADLQEFLDAPFDLGGDFPVRVGHFTLPDGASVVCLVAHHIVIDGTSLQILVEELSGLYGDLAERGEISAELAGTAPLLLEPEPSPEATRYWLDHLDGVRPEAMALPGTRPAPARPTFAGRTRTWEMTPEARAAMEALRRELRVTDNLVLMSAFYLTLARHGAGPDLVVGVPVDTRRPATQKQVGYGVSTLPIRVRVDPDESFRVLAHRVGEAFFGGLEQTGATAEVVITERGHGTSDWRVPLFRHIYNHRPWTDERIRFGGQMPEYVKDIFDRSRVDMQFVAVPKPEEILLRVSYSTEVHDDEDMVAFVARLQALLERAAADPDRPVGELEFASGPERAVLDAANGTDRDWGAPETLAEAIAARTGAETAVVDGELRLSYHDLLARAVAIRDALRSRGVRRGDIVALALGRSASLASAVLGVWAAGASYLPLDAHHPAMRLAYQVEDADARLVLVADEGTAHSAWSGGRSVVAVRDLPPGDTATLLDQGPPDPGDTAYVIYTSGSTGRPKGVAVTHGNLANLVRDFADRLPVEASAGVLWSTTPAFDISALELFLPLLTGGRLVVASDEAQLRPRVFLDLIRDQDVSVVQATPTAWRMTVPEVDGELAGRTVLCGGEPMPATLARDLLARGCRLFNVYGPTETTIWSTAAELSGSPEDPVPIGRPLANTRVFVLDARGQELPPGVPGELCIAGAGVAVGYLGRPELTAERFGTHPRHGRFYRTGDLARLRHDGTLEMLGRSDRQVKLRGHRIELGEVEAALHEHHKVRLAAVTLAGDPQTDGRLVAFVQPDTGTGGQGTLRDELWRHARTRLPDYAVPSAIVVVDRIPITPNGKIAYRELLETAAPQHAAPAVATGGDPELTERLVGLWRETLGRPELGAHDNFFLNGGHSILAVGLTTRLEEITGDPVAVPVIFQYPTPAELSAHLAAPGAAG